ncbi:MAG: rhodanese-like domain-containing protein [Verrucomicrobiae bacterium]|nr:rhodanese-like domain-containing protein [Verrucomicrobiae bacterium]
MAHASVMHLGRWLLMGGLLLPALLSAAGGPEVAQLNAREFARRAAEPGVVLLDVRTAREVKNGRIQGAVHLDLTAPDFEERLARLDKQATYLVYCASGVRSARACQKLQAMGFPRAFNLQGGLLAWQAAGLPLEK